MLKNEININAPIISGVGLGGFLLGMNETDLLNLISDKSGNKNFSEETKYFFHNNSICVTFSDEKKRVFRISALEGYLGLLDNQIYVDMKITDLLTLDSNWKYSEEQSAYQHHLINGVAICSVLEDATEEEARNSYIGEISVFNMDFY